MNAIFSVDFTGLLFFFFLYSILGWFFELSLELVFRSRFVKNRGFFYGPWIPIYAIALFLAYAVSASFRTYPVLVFFTGSIFCILVEFLAAFILEKVFYAKAWDYRLFPFGKWSIYNGSISLIPAIFFGCVMMAMVYVLWDKTVLLINYIPDTVLYISDLLLSVLFLIDIILSARKCFRNKSQGILTKANGL